MKHRFFVLFIGILLLVLPLTAGAEEIASGSCGEEMVWVLEGETLTISGNGSMDNFEDTAPWAAYQKEITKVVISDGVTTVGDFAFKNYDSIKEVEFGDAIHTLGKESFRDCDGLERIHLPQSFRVFDEESLRDCRNLKAIHCEGGFPSFRLNCLWGSTVKIYYPANRPWPVSLIQELEEAFHNRIEFLDSNGHDPYVPEESTEATTEPTTAPTTEPTTAPTTEPTTAPTTEPTTAPTTEATTEPTTEATTVPTTKATEATTAPPFTYTAPQTEPTEAPKGSGSAVGVALIGFVLCSAGLGVLLFNKPGRGGKYRR